MKESRPTNKVVSVHPSKVEDAVRDLNDLGYRVVSLTLWPHEKEAFTNPVTQDTKTQIFSTLIVLGELVEA